MPHSTSLRLDDTDKKNLELLQQKLGVSKSKVVSLLLSWAVVNDFKAEVEKIKYKSNFGEFYQEKKSE